MNKKFQRYSAFAFFSVTIALGAAASAHADETAECAQARRNAGWIPALFRDDATCDLGEDNKAVRAESYAAALTNFRSVKTEFMNQLDRDTAGTVGADLEAIRSAAATYVSAHSSDKPELCEKLHGMVSKIQSLVTAADNMRPEGATNLGRIATIDRAFGGLQDTCGQFEDGNKPTSCPGAGKGALEQIDHILQTETGPSTDPALAPLKDKLHAFTGDGSRLAGVVSDLVRLHNIQTCRNYDGQLYADRNKVHACSATPKPDQHANPAPGPDDATRQLCGVLSFPIDLVCDYVASRNTASVSDKPAPAAPAPISGSGGNGGANGAGGADGASGADGAGGAPAGRALPANGGNGAGGAPGYSDDYLDAGVPLPGGTS